MKKKRSRSTRRKIRRIILRTSKHENNKKMKKTKMKKQRRRSWREGCCFGEASSAWRRDQKGTCDTNIFGMTGRWETLASPCASHSIRTIYVHPRYAERESSQHQLACTTWWPEQADPLWQSKIPCPLGWLYNSSLQERSLCLGAEDGGDVC